jgi:putative glutamine amidotransferase
MAPPLIGITTYGRGPENKYGLPAEYVEAIRRAGGIPLLIPPGEPNLDALLSAIDGLILAGGGDLDPELYEGSQHETIYMVDDERDLTELRMAAAVVARDVPTLGICRGVQVINVALGGTLIEHLPDVVGEAVAHRAPPRLPTNHGVRLDPDSHLATILQTDEIDSASWHHQALRRLGDGLRVVAWAPDGTVEAVEMPGHPWLYAVQWHPELTAAHDPVQQRLFDTFVDACRLNRAQRNGSS